MSITGAADEWDVVVPADGEQLMAELRRHGVRPGQRLHVVATPDITPAGETWPPPWVASFANTEPDPRHIPASTPPDGRRQLRARGAGHSGRHEVSERVEEILRSEVDQ
jgi:hypothetical protein